MIKKKALSPIIAYVILVTIVLSTSLVVYPWLKTYIAISPVSCPDGVSIFLNKIDTKKLEDNKFQLNISIKNNGFFGVGGYFINFRNTEGKLIPWGDNIKIDSNKVTEIMRAEIVQRNMKPGIDFIVPKSDSGMDVDFTNPLLPEEVIESSFTVDENITSIELIPFRKTEKGVIISCGYARIIERVKF